MNSRCDKSNDGKHHFTKNRVRTRAEFINGVRYGGRMQTRYVCICCREWTRRKPARKEYPKL